MANYTRYLHDLEPNLEQTQHFLTLLDEEAESFTFQTFDDNKASKDPALTWIFHGTLKQHASALMDLNKRGAGVFVTANVTDGEGRKTANITRIRAVWQEDDGEGKPLPLEPHITVQTSPGKYHRYLLVDGMSQEDARHAQRTMVARYACDPNAADVSRVLRLPGFFHVKYPEHPHLVQIVQESAAQPYTKDQIFTGLCVNVVELRPGTPAPSLEGKPLPEGLYKLILSALAFIPAEDRALWLKIGMALHSTSAVQAFDLWDTWSQKSDDKYDRADLIRVWNSFGQRSGISLGTLYHHAATHGWKAPRNQTIGGLEPKYTSRAITPEQASTELDRLTGQDLQGMRAIEGAAGMGKSTRIQKAVESRIKAKEINSGLIFVPSNRLGKEAVKRSEVDARSQKGRLQEGVRGPLCRREDLVRNLNDRGIYNVMGLLCKSKEACCPHFNHCEYILQSQERQLKALPHNYLTLPRTILDSGNDPDVLIIDESFHSQVEAFGKWPIGELLATGIDLLKDLVNILIAGEPILPTLRQRQKPLAEIDAALKQYEKHLPAISPNMPDKAIGKAILEFSQEGVKKIPYRLLTTLKTALESNAPETTSIWYDKKNHLVRAAWLKPIAKHYQGTPTFVLDATMNTDLLRHSFPDLEHYKIGVERNAHVTQVMSTTLSNRRLEPLDSDPEDMKRQAEQLKTRLERKVAKLAEQHGPGLIVGKMSYMETFTTPDECMRAHFGDLRGRNQWKHLQWVIVIGRNEPPVTAIENRARCYYGNDPETLKLTGTVENRPAGYRMRDGEQVGVMGRYHTDERVQAIMELAREDESIQAIDRIRLIYGELKHVYIVCNLPLDITVDRLVTMREFLGEGDKLERTVQKCQVLILNPPWLHKHFPDVFETAEIAKKFIYRTLKNVPTSINNYLIESGTFNFKQVKFRFAGQRGKMMTALTTLDDGKTQAWLKREFGKPLVAYDRVEPPKEEAESLPKSELVELPVWQVFTTDGLAATVRHSSGKPITRQQAKRDALVWRDLVGMGASTAVPQGSTVPLGFGS